jgi:hypothetical protein
VKAAQLGVKLGTIPRMSTVVASMMAPLEASKLLSTHSALFADTAAWKTLTGSFSPAMDAATAALQGAATRAAFYTVNDTIGQSDVLRSRVDGLLTGFTGRGSFGPPVRSVQERAADLAQHLRDDSESLDALVDSSEALAEAQGISGETVIELGEILDLARGSGGGKVWRAVYFTTVALTLGMTTFVMEAAPVTAAIWDAAAGGAGLTLSIVGILPKNKDKKPE